MPADAHANFVISTVATPPSPAISGTSLILSAGEGTRFPDPASVGAYNVVVWASNTLPTPLNAEIVRVTAKSTDTLTITRAQEGSSARTIIASDHVALAITAKKLTDMETDIAAALVSRTRSLWIPAAEFVIASGSPTHAAQNSGAYDAWQLDAASTELLVAQISIPSDWASDFAASVFWTNGGGGSGDVRWRVGLNNAGATGGLNATTNADATATAPAQHVLAILASAAALPFAGGANQIVQVNVGRIGGNGADTLANDCCFLGLRIDYTSDL